MSDFDPFKQEQEALERAERILLEQSPEFDLHVEFEALVHSYRKLFKASRRLVRMSDRSEHHLKEANIRIKAQQEKLESEINFAKHIQMSMVPGNGDVLIENDGFQLYAYLAPARSVGGDFYFFQPKDARLNFIIGDVSDKGVPAALVMAKTVTLYHNALNEGLTPGNIFSQMNEALCLNNEASMFVTALCGYLDFNDGKLVLANAGHMNPLLVNEGRSAELMVDGGTPLGLMEGMTYADVDAAIEQGASLFMYTDGITEAKNPQELQYEDERLGTIIHQNCMGTAAEIAKATLEDVARFSAGAEQSDDITLMVIQRGV